MAKDPAVLWYWSDWNSGTGLMSRFLKGCYMDLLHAQFNHGRLSLEEIKICLGSDFGTSWPALQKKFKQDDKGLFFNERLEQEQIKRKAYSQSRRENVSKRYEDSTHVGTYVDHMNIHMENENRNTDSIKDSTKSEKQNGKILPIKVSYKNWDEEAFKKELSTFLEDYGRDTLNEFFKYWSEKSPSGKMKFQLEKTWETKKRLGTWQRIGETSFKKN